MAFTVTVTQGGGTAAGMALSVIVLTGATAAGGKTLGTQQTGAAQGTITPNFTGSLIYWGIANFSTNAAWTLNGSNSDSATGVGDYSDATSGDELTIGVYTGTVTSGVGVTIGASAPTGNATSIAAYEIPQSGSIAVNASTPVFTHNTSTSIGLSVSPPGGAVLVAVVASCTNGSSNQTLTASDNSGLGLIWTQRIISNAANLNNNACAVFTATMPAASTGTGLLPQPGGQTWRRRFRRPQQVMSPGIPPLSASVTPSTLITLTSFATTSSSSAIPGLLIPGRAIPANPGGSSIVSVTSTMPYGAGLSPQPGGSTWRRRFRRPQQVMPANGSGSISASVTTTALNVSSSFPAVTVNAGSVVTPAVLSTSAAFSAPTVNAGVVITPSVLAVSAVFTTPSFETDTNLTTAVLSGTVSLPPPTINAGSVVTPSVLSGSVSFAAPAVDVITSPALNVSATFSAPAVDVIVTAVLSGSVSFSPPTVNAGSGVTLSNLAVAASFPAPTVNAGSVVTTPALSTSATFSAPAVDIITPPALSTSATFSAPAVDVITPGILSVSATFSPPTVSAGGNANVTPAVLSVSASFSAPTVNAGSGVTTSVLSGSATFPAPAIDVIAPALLSVSATFPAPAVDVITAPGLSGTSTFAAPTVNAGSGVTPGVLSGTVSFAAPAVDSVTPAVLSGTVSFPAPAVDVVTPAVLSVSATFAAPSVTAGGNATATPAVLSVSATFAAPTINISKTATPSLLSATTAFAALAVNAGAVVTPPAVSSSASFTTPGLTVSSQITAPAFSGSTTFAAPGITSGGVAAPAFFEQFLGGTAVNYGAYGGIAAATVQSRAYGGSAVMTTSTAGLVIQSSNAYGGTGTRLNMPTMQNLQTDANNDTTFTLQVTQFGSPLNLTGYTLKLYVKATQQSPDSGATVYTLGAGLTMLQVRGGLFNFVLPHTATTVPGTQWWRVDIIDGSGNTGTALYGNLYILPV